MSKKIKKKPSPYGRGGSPEQFRKRLQEIETLYGREAAAQKIGVSSATFGRYKTGSTPNRDAVKAANRVRGRNKTKIEDPAFQEKIKKRAEKSAKLSAATKKRYEIITLDVRKWVEEHFHDEPIWMQHGLLNAARQAGKTYAVFNKDDPKEAQLISPEEYMNSGIGKPPKKDSIIMLGVISHYSAADKDKQSLVFMKRDLLGYFNEQWDINKTLDMARSYFFQEVDKGQGSRKIRDTPEQFLTYYYQ